MTLGELAKKTGYPETTIKFLLREKLLPAGKKITERLADYTEKHVERLLLIKALHDRIGVQYSDILPITTAIDRDLI